MQDRYRDLLNDYLDDQLDSLETLLVEEHLNSCAECKRELNQLKLLDWELKHQPEIDLPPELMEVRIAAIKNYLKSYESLQGNSRVRDFLELQVSIMSNTSRFLSLNPINQVLNRTAKSSVSALGKVAGAILNKKKPRLLRIIPGQA